MSASIKPRTQRFICCLVAVRVVAICNGSADLAAHDCFTCRDKDRCPKIVRIFGPGDALLFEKDPEDKIPNCSEVRLVPRNCSVCVANSNILIYCPSNIQRFDGEMIGMQITNISKGCEEEQNTNPALKGQTTGASQISVHTGILFGGLFLTMLG